MLDLVEQGNTLLQTVQLAQAAEQAGTRRAFLPLPRRCSVALLAG